MCMTALHILCCNPNVTLGMVRVFQAAYPKAATIQNASGMTSFDLFLYKLIKQLY
jgi:hypothetical protein